MICCVYRRGRFFWGKLRLRHEVHMSRFSLGTTDRRVAQTNLLQIAREREMEHAGLLAPSTVRQAASLPVIEQLDEYLAQLLVKGRMPTTLKKYRSNIASCINACGWKVLRDMSARSFCEWRAHCGLSGKTMNDALGGLNAFTRWLVFQRRILESPFAHVERVDLRGTDGQHRRALSSEELAKFLASVPESRRVIYLTAVRTGLRRTEIKHLRWGDVFLESAALRARASTTKNRRDAVLPLCPELLAALQAHRPADAAPFTPVFACIPNFRTVRQDFQRAGIALVDEGGRRVDFHALRGTFATDLVLAGASPHETKELMRHSDLKLTMKHYVDAGKLQLSSVVAKLPSVSTDVPKSCPVLCPDRGHTLSGPVAQ